MGTLIFSYIHKLRPLLGFKILNFNIFGRFHKTDCFGGIKRLWILVWSHQKVELELGVIFMHFWGQGTERLIF